jgi:hypothetical protein
MSTPAEPAITVNGRRLTEAQAMTVRVALNHFSRDMGESGALGGGEHGKAMSKAYQHRAGEALEMMAGG